MCLNFNNHKTLQQAVVKDQINEKLIALDMNTFLSSDK